MRRLAAIALTLLAALAAVAALGWRNGAQGSSTSRFDVIFDDARGLIGGQLVKVAGAKAGTIENVVVTPDFKARIEATVESRFMPFHTDATCTIRPEGLIAENYVDCDPGTMGAPPLRGKAGQPPTVPVTHTTEPVSLLDLFNIFNLPTRQRFTAIVDELGIGTAGRGNDFNTILLRANPTLVQARQVIAILSSQRAQLAQAVDATGAIAAEAAGHPAAIQGFLDRASALASLTASHRDSISRAVKRLPGLLAAAQPSLADLDTVAREGTPLVAQLHAAVPSLNRVARDLGPFAAAAQPGLAALRVALRQAIPAIRDTNPLVSTVRAYAQRSLPGTKLFARLGENLQQHGFSENFLSVVYYVQASLARFDSTSHMLALLLVGAHNGQCGSYATTPVTGCSAHFGQQPAYQPQAAAARAAKALPTTSTPATSPNQVSGLLPSAPQPTSAPAGRSASPAAAPSRNSSAPPAPPAPASGAGGGDATGPLQNLINYLLR